MSPEIEQEVLRLVRELHAAIVGPVGEKQVAAQEAAGSEEDPEIDTCPI